MLSAAPPSAASIRTALAARCGDDSPPGAWRAAAAAAGATGADGFLCHLSQSVIGALERLAGSAEVARDRLMSAREVRRVEAELLRSHFEELDERITAAESVKRAALERELCAIDVALEQLRAERGAVAEALASLGDAELLVQLAELKARLDAADARLLALPTSVIEPPFVGLVIDEPALVAGNAAFGRVVAPHAVTAADLAIQSAPSYICAGCNLLLYLVMVHYSSQTTEELEVSLCAAAEATRVGVSLETEGTAPQALQADAIADVSGRRIIVSIIVPAAAPVGSAVCFGTLTVSGHPVDGLPGALRVEPSGPDDLSPEHAAQLQAWLPPGGSSSPGAWVEVYRATTHGFGAAAFHERCDERARLLVLVRAKEGGWLFGGFTATGFSIPPGPSRYIVDPAAFLFSLTNTLGRPEKLESKQTGHDVFYHPDYSAVFSAGYPTHSAIFRSPCDLVICGDADKTANSFTSTGHAYAKSASMEAHPMAQGQQGGWLAAEVVAWVV